MSGNELFGDVFWYGASCAPYAKSMDWPMEQWESDVATMRKMGFSVARIFVPWDRIEREEGTFDFSKQDHFMDVAAKHGLSVLLNVGGVFNSMQGIYPPRWLVRDHSLNPLQDEPKIPVRQGGQRISVCLDEPTYREKALAFIARATRRYADHPATAGWMVWNEPGISPCYCPVTASRFSGWLKNRYDGRLDELNRLWGSEFPLDYEDWSELEPPWGCGFHAGGLNAWRDWLEFNQWRLTEAMLAINRTIKENDSGGHPTTANMCVGHGIHGAFACVRMSEVREALDVMGYSYYTVAHGEGRNLTPFLKALQVDAFRWYSRESNQRTLVLETEAGPNAFMITEEQRTLNNWLAIGHNAKSIVCWNYRSRFSDNQVGSFNMMAWDGSSTPRAEHHAGMAKTLNRHARLINNCFPESEAAVLVSDSLTVMAMATHIGVHSGHWRSEPYNQVAKSRWGAFKLLWDMNVPADGLAECDLKDIGKYQVVLLPMIENMTPEIAETLRRYVAGGGTLIAESPFAFKDENNFLSGKAPIYGLDEVFGAFTRDREGRETASEITYADGTKADVCFLWHPYEPTTAQVEAAYADGRAAVAVNRFGKGKTIVFGTEVFRQYMDAPEAATTNYLRCAVLDSGVVLAAEVVMNGNIADESGVEVCRLSGESGVMYVVLNHNDGDVSFDLRIREDTDGWFNMEDGDRVDLDAKIELPPLGVLAFAKER